MGLGCFAGGDTSKQGEIKRKSRGIKRKSRGVKWNQEEIKRNQEEIKRNQEESRGVKGNQGDQCEPRKNGMK